MKPLIGLIGMGASQAVGSLPTDGTPTSEIVKIVVNVIIGLVTIFHLFKKPKEVLSNQNT